MKHGTLKYCYLKSIVNHKLAYFPTLFIIAVDCEGVCRYAYSHVQCAVRYESSAKSPMRDVVNDGPALTVHILYTRASINTSLV